MKSSSPYALTIAGHDPSGGAGLTSDCLIFSGYGLHPLSVCTANTIQTDTEFKSVNWVPDELIVDQLQILLATYRIGIAKIGIIRSTTLALQMVRILKEHDVKVVWDPVVATSTGTSIMEFDQREVEELLSLCFVSTPNANEAIRLTGATTIIDAITRISSLGNVIVKSVEVNNSVVKDFISHDGMESFHSHHVSGVDRHGTGCLFSAVIAAETILGATLMEAASRAAERVSHYRKTGEKNMDTILVDQP